MSSSESLFPSAAAIKRAELCLIEKLEGVRTRQAERRASPPVPTADWRAQLAAFDFREARDLEGAIDWAIDSLENGIIQMTHPGYLGLFNPAPTFPSECADRIVDVFNPQICVWSHAPKAVEIELHVIRNVAMRAGLGETAGGHFTSGGAEANATALVCALTAKTTDFGERGVRAFQGRPTLYASKESHLAWFKIAHAAGVGREAVRLVETDGRGRMSIRALEAMIAADAEAGCTPVLIAATAGTTNAGMVDPLTDCRSIANRHDLWCHIDAAWGGALMASPDHCAALHGIETADSITVDAHKWFATTMGAGMFLTRRPEVLADAFRVNASYMPESNAENDFYLNSFQWSRRFVGLRLFLSLATAGWSGYAEHVAHGVRLIERLSSGLQTIGWRQENASPMAVGCFTPPEGEGAVQHYVSAVQASGRFWVSKAIFEGRPVLRACLTNGRTTDADIDRLVSFLADFAL